ncbi:MAG: Coenzyme F420 hydrogenase/dehydrogenase, beta subunit C-terminal domain [Candidatus Bathyarchaeia archaeon]
MRLQSEVISKGLCCGCGTCAGVCPNGAINMTLSKGLFKPEINWDLCTNCQMCLKACPGGNLDLNELQLHVFGKKPVCRTMGNFQACYRGYALNEKIRFNSASGGIITQLLIFALENKIIDGAIVTRMNPKKPMETQAFIAKTKEDLIDAAKSKYCPVAANTCLSQVLKEDGKYALVGLPCHINGVRKAETIIKALESKIVLKFGLLCSHTVDFAGISFLLKKLGIAEDQIRRMSYRGQGWPGYLVVETKDNYKVTVPLVASWHAYWPLFSSFFFTPMRCTMCPDQAAELADLSFGDAWLPEMRNDQKGASIVISRTNRGQQLLEAAVAAKAVVLAPLDISRVEESQLVNLRFKKDDLPYRLSFLASMGKSTPVHNELQTGTSSISALRSMYVYSNIKATSNRGFRVLLTHVPFPVIRLYYGIYKSLCKIGKGEKTWTS